ncbi:MAG: ribosome-associated translation inhibitor RaiA [Paludibacteraceae bacterium]|nr:ribosome-associated translation inhibitor RaiA [Paludibacteraceae bacterium]
MIIKINSVRFDASDKLEKFVESKVSKLGQFFDEIISAEVFLRVEKPQAVENKIAEIRLEVPGATDLFAKKQADTFEEATDLSVDALKKQLTKFKEKLRGE